LSLFSPQKKKSSKTVEKKGRKEGKTKTTIRITINLKGKN